MKKLSSKVVMKVASLGLAVMMLVGVFGMVPVSGIQGVAAKPANANTLTAQARNDLLERFSAQLEDKAILNMVAQMEPVSFEDVMGRSRFDVMAYETANAAAFWARFDFNTVPENLQDNVLAARSVIVYRGGFSWATSSAVVFDVETGETISELPLYDEVFPHWNLTQIQEFYHQDEIEPTGNATALIDLIPASGIRLPIATNVPFTMVVNDGVNQAPNMFNRSWHVPLRSVGAWASRLPAGATTYNCHLIMRDTSFPSRILAEAYRMNLRAGQGVRIDVNPRSQQGAINVRMSSHVGGAAQFSIDGEPG